MRLGFVLVLQTALLGVSVQAAPLVGNSPDFCGHAQQLIAQTNLMPVVEQPASYEAFVESKAFDQPFTVQQYWSSHLPGDDAPVTTVSCKMRTAERINAVQGVEAEHQPVASGDLSCEDVLLDMLSQVYAVIPADEQQLDEQQFVVAPEDMKFMGPSWLEPWPFEPVSQLEDGSYHLYSRSLYVPHAWWIPMPERFLGNYYCHLIAPDYLRTLIRGEQASRQSAVKHTTE
jgi:hypothetical protein